MFSCFKSEAEKIGQLRNEVNYYYVTESAGLFGDFRGWGSIITPKPERVVARSAKEAAQRYARRNYSDSPGAVTTKQWAKYRVRQANKPEHERHYTYFR